MLTQDHARPPLRADASGWIFKFIKAMRDDQGELLPNAHLVGFFRRICRLLFHNIRPVFIFDGATPALKRRTVVERRRRREQQGLRVGKTAEKLLLNQLKQHALADFVEAQQGAGPAAPATDEVDLTDAPGTSRSHALAAPAADDEAADLALAVALAAEEEEAATGGGDLDGLDLEVLPEVRGGAASAAPCPHPPPASLVASCGALTLCAPPCRTARRWTRRCCPRCRRRCSGR